MIVYEGEHDGEHCYRCSLCGRRITSDREWEIRQIHHQCRQKHLEPPAPLTPEEIADRLRTQRDEYIDHLITTDFAQVNKQTILDRISRCESLECRHLEGHCTRRGSGCQQMTIWLQFLSGRNGGECEEWIGVEI